MTWRNLLQRQRRPWRHVGAGLLGLGMIAVLGVVPGPAPAGAATPGAHWAIADSWCDAQPTNWWGGVHNNESPSYEHPSGTVSLCWETFRAISVDTEADYHAMVVRSNWTASGPANYPASMFQTISSNTATRDFYKHATGSTASTTSCTHPIDVSAGHGFLSIGTELKMCSSFSVSRYYLTDTGAGWHTPKAGGIRQMETVFLQKVDKGANVCLTAELAIPQYDIEAKFNYFLSTAHLRWTTYRARCSNSGGSGGGEGSGGAGDGDEGGENAPPTWAEPAMVYDQGDDSMKIYRWMSTGSDFARLTDYQSGAFHLSRVRNRVAAGDVDGDGDDDVVMAYQEDNGTFSFFVFKEGRRGQGRWYTSGPFSLGPVDGRLVLGDFTGDGKAEPALVRDNGDGTMKIYRWASTGSSFTRLPDYQSGSFHLSRVGDRVAAGDVDGDGDDDVVMAYQENDGTFSYFVFKEGIRGQGRWYTSGAFNLAAVDGRLVLDDFTGDGKAEPTLVRDNGDGTMKIYRWASTGSSFTRQDDYQSGSFGLGNVGDRVASGDITGDGKADIVMAYQNGDGTATLHVFRTGSQWAGRWYTGGSYTLANVAGRLVVGNWA